ncbi:MAG: hypothetical protein H0T73_18945 [Ardenticatenales bacterium]|nr:hypothetical protein [Ardenticatenales bacterium]
MSVKQATAWAISLIIALPLTYITFLLTAVPFIEAGAFTVFSLLLMTVFVSFFVDMAMKASLYDARGWHLGFYDPMGPLGKDDAKPGKDYEPIVSREERLKQQKKKQTA